MKLIRDSLGRIVKGDIARLLAWREAHPEVAQGIEIIRKWQRERPSEYSKTQSLVNRLGHAKRTAAVRASPRAKEAWRKIINDPALRKKAIAARSRNPKMMKNSVKHCLAKLWLLRDPQNRTYRCKNLARFVRMHSELFDEQDVAWSRISKGWLCRAYYGLSSLRPSHPKPTGSWKGWTWAANSAVSTRVSRDILGRKLRCWKEKCE